MTTVDSYTSYQALIRPDWAPPAWVVALPFVLNLVFNLSFTYFQFGLKNNTLAAVDVLLVLATLVWALYVIYPYITWVALANIPYLLWAGFATILQLTITYLNY